MLILILIFWLIPSSIVKATVNHEMKNKAAEIPTVKEEKSFEAQMRYVRFKLDDLMETRNLLTADDIDELKLLQLEADIEKLRNQLIRLEAK